MGFYLRKRADRFVEAAQQLLEAITSGKKIKSKIAKDIYKECQGDKETMLLKAIELIGNPTSNRELYIVSGAYVILGEKYNDKAIEYLEKYRDAGAYFDQTPQGKIDMYGRTYQQLDSNISSVYICLASAYEKAHRFEEAISACQKGIDLFDGNATYYILLARLKGKRDGKDASKAVINQAKKTVFYEKDMFFKNILDAHRL